METKHIKNIEPFQQIDKKVIFWLLEGDPSVRWQVLEDLVNARQKTIRAERQKIEIEGWGARLLSLQDKNGLWGGGLYSPKWISTTYTLLLLRRMGLNPHNEQAQLACQLLLDKGFYKDHGINYFSTLNNSETCVTGMVLSLLAYFDIQDPRVDQIVDYILKEQFEDGGWNCWSYKGATHSSFHTTITVLESLWEYLKNFNKKAIHIEIAMARAHEFLYVHKLFRSHRTGKIVHPKMIRFSFPPRWRYDIMRALDYLQDCGAKTDDRCQTAIKIIKSKEKDGFWPLQNRQPGQTFFEMEELSKPSRWNTLRALRILKWWDGERRLGG